MKSDTTIIFVPGAWHNVLGWHAVGSRLKHEHGYNVTYVNLASWGADPPLVDFTDDVAVIRGAIEKAVEAGQKVLLVFHSYGGVPGTEAVKGLDVESRQREGKSGGVVRLVYCAAFMLAEGQCLADAFGEDSSARAWQRVSEDGLSVIPTTPAETFYNDLAKDQAAMNVAGLKPHSFQTLFSKLTYAAWKYVPTTYLYCLR